MKWKYLVDKWIKWVLAIAGISTIAVLLGIFFMLMVNGVKVFQDIGPGELFGSTWEPSSYTEPQYGILPLIAGSLMVTVGSLIISIPLGIGAAAYMAEYASPRAREILKPAVEMLAGIPSVAIGFLGIVLVGPLIKDIFGSDNGTNALNGSILLAVMSLPTIISVSDDAISAVPRSYKEAAYALGANKWITLIKVILPAAFSGIMAGVILGMGRAIGETMTVLMVTGNSPAMPNSFFDSVETMTAAIAIELGDLPVGGTHYHSLFAIGAVLFLISLAVNFIAELVIRRYRIN